MARPLLKRSEALAWLPASAELGSAALLSDTRLLVWLGNSRTPQLLALEDMSGIKKINLVIDARDVLLLAAQVPPLSAQKLAQALPNIIEDRLLQDASEVVIALGDKLPDGQRQLAIADRAWLEQVKNAFDRRGIKVGSIWPAQLALPQRDGRWIVAAVGNGLTLRTAQSGIGWSAGHSEDERVAALHGLFDAAKLGEHLSPDQSTVDAVIDDTAWSEPLAKFAEQRNIRFEIFSLPRPVPCSADLSAAASGKIGQLATGKKFNWSTWRWPLWLAAACALVGVVGINAQWWLLAREKADLKLQAEQTFKAAFPSAGVVVDPPLQAQRLVSAMRGQSGQMAPEDFTVLITKFSDAIEAVAVDSLSSVDFKDGRLKVKFQPGYADSPEARDQLRKNLSRSGLKIQFDDSASAKNEALATISVNQ